MKPQKGDALLIVDVQRDFLPGGALSVKEGDKVIGPINRLISLFSKRSLPIFATRDWHPEDHSSFKEFGGIWPSHCVAESKGAAFPEDLRLPNDAIIISKGTKREKDAYSGFEGTILFEDLKKLDVKRLFVTGLATDYCVLNTVLDALRLGFECIVIEDAIRAVDLKEGDGQRAIKRMKDKGAIFLRQGEIE